MNKLKFYYINLKIVNVLNVRRKLNSGDWGLGIGGLGIGPIPNPQSPFIEIINKKNII